MSSQVGGDLSKIQTGPCEVKYKNEQCGHTMDGVKFNITHDLRDRFVDEYGTTPVDKIHQGDNVEVKMTFAEKTMAIIQTVYQFGYSISSTLWGIGRVPGTKASSLAGELLLHPLDGDGTTDDVTFWKAFVQASGEVQFGVITADRVFEATFGCLIDESKSNGYLIGRIGAPASS